ncbi:restriction endonuclease subunit S [Anaerocaecibacter muris]|uniref:restriction endonuclease subunit S n=1 Tax=Anaerocaecibacter muris TaxID=2941513 RepID=UPI003F690979
MSKLEELINTLCPNGVEYKILGEICNIVTGGEPPKDQIKSKFPQADYIYPIYSNGIGLNALWGYAKTYRIETKAITFSSIGTIGYPTLREGKFTPIIRLKVINPKNETELNIKYLKYILDIVNFNKQKSSVSNVNAKMVANIKIPVPPIEVQLEIVRILDNFSELTSELIAKLSEECSKIKKQYEYLKDKCLDFNGKIPTKRFGELARIVRGASPRPIHAFITEKSDGINWIKIGDVKVGNKYITETKEKINKIGASKSRIVKEGDFLLSNSMSFGRPYISAIEGCIHDGWLAISNFEATLTRDFLYHLLSSTKIQRILAKKASFGGAVQNLNADIVRSIELPIPPYAEQKRIAAILDQLDELYNSITKNILTEIEARKKQYEYYRDKLLTFKELS